MKTIYITTTLVISSIFFLSSTCVGSKPKGKTKQEYTSLDSIWLPFAKAMESKDIEFLVRNSLDSVTCNDCHIDSINQQEYFDADFIFKIHLDKIMHLPTLTDRDFSTYNDNGTIRIWYSVKARYSPERAYGLLFTLVRKGDKYFFQGMLVQ